MTNEELDRLISVIFGLPPAHYSTELEAALQLVAHLINNWQVWLDAGGLYHPPYFKIEYYPDDVLNSSKGTWGISFEPYGFRLAKNPATGICLNALYCFKEIKIDEATIKVVPK